MQLTVGSLDESVGVAARCGGDVRLACFGVLEHALRLLLEKAWIVPDLRRGVRYGT
jgi:hypothetical protein